MKIQRFRISKNGQLAGMVFITENDQGKIATILPLAATGGWPAVDFEAQRLIHQQFVSQFHAGEIVRQLIERAGMKMTEVTVSEIDGLQIVTSPPPGHQ